MRRSWRRTPVRGRALLLLPCSWLPPVAPLRHAAGRAPLTPPCTAPYCLPYRRGAQAQRALRRQRQLPALRHAAGHQGEREHCAASDCAREGAGCAEARAPSTGQQRRLDVCLLSCAAPVSLLQVVNLLTNRVVKIVGKVESTERFLRIALYQVRACAAFLSPQGSAIVLFPGRVPWLLLLLPACMPPSTRLRSVPRFACNTGHPQALQAPARGP